MAVSDTENVCDLHASTALDDMCVVSVYVPVPEAEIVRVEPSDCSNPELSFGTASVVTVPAVQLVLTSADEPELIDVTTIGYGFGLLTVTVTVLEAPG